MNENTNEPNQSDKNERSGKVISVDIRGEGVRKNENEKNERNKRKKMRMIFQYSLIITPIHMDI
jgi:hypothetical protein